MGIEPSFWFDQQTIPLSISILSLLISIIALFFSYRKYRRDKPILTISPYISSYSIHEHEFPTPHELKIKASFLVNNSGDISTSITESSSMIRLLPNSSIIELMLKQNAILGSVNPENLPVEIKANCTTTISLNYSFEYDNFQALDSCIRFLIPERQDGKIILKSHTRDDVVLHVNFNFSTTHKQIMFCSGCIFREDQPESKIPDIERKGLLRSSVSLARNLEDELLVV